MFVAAEVVQQFLSRELESQYPGCVIRQVPPGTEVAEIPLGEKRAGPWPWSKRVPDVVYVPLEPAETAALEVEEDGRLLAKITYRLHVGYDPYRRAVAWWFEILATEMGDGGPRS